jgi:hypothetical protein
VKLALIDTIPTKRIGSNLKRLQQLFDHSAIEVINEFKFGKSKISQKLSFQQILLGRVHKVQAIVVDQLSFWFVRAMKYSENTSTRCS